MKMAKLLLLCCVLVSSCGSDSPEKKSARLDEERGEDPQNSPSPEEKPCIVSMVFEYDAVFNSQNGGSPDKVTHAYYKAGDLSEECDAYKDADVRGLDFSMSAKSKAINGYLYAFSLDQKRLAFTPGLSLKNGDVDNSKIATSKWTGKLDSFLNIKAQFEYQEIVKEDEFPKEIKLAIVRNKADSSANGSGPQPATQTPGDDQGKPVEVTVDCYKAYPTFINGALPFSTNCKVTVDRLKAPTRITWEKANDRCIGVSGTDQSLRTDLEGGAR